MNLSSSSINQSNKFSYQVLIEYLPESQVKATVLGWENCQVIGISKEQTLSKLQDLLSHRLQNTEIVSLEVEITKKEHPWLKFAGMFKDDPVFDDVIEDINNYRRELDQKTYTKEEEK